MKYYSQLNGFRFICILLVLFEHWLPYVVYKYTRSGVIGVNLFFVLSGFLLGEILILQKRKETSIGDKIKNFY